MLSAYNGTTDNTPTNEWERSCVILGTHRSEIGIKNFSVDFKFRYLSVALLLSRQINFTAIVPFQFFSDTETGSVMCFFLIGCDHAYSWITNWPCPVWPMQTKCVKSSSHFWDFILSLPRSYLMQRSSSQLFGSPSFQFAQLSTWIYRWFSAKLQQLQCVNNGVTAVLHQVIDILQYIWKSTSFLASPCQMKISISLTHR